MQGTKENIVRLDADHRSMCKFDLSCQHDADSYKLVVGNLKTLYRDCTSIGEKSMLNHQEKNSGIENDLRVRE